MTIDLGAKPVEGEKLGSVGVLTVIALIAGCLQSVLIALSPSTGGLTLFDDAVVVLLVLTALFRLGRAPAAPIYLIVCWVLLMGFAAAWSTIPNELTFVLFRQVTIPTLLVFIGITLTGHEWQAVVKWSIRIGIANAVYMCLELAGVRLLDPVAYARYDSPHLLLRDGLPANYFYYLDSFGVVERAGGLVLNPPVAGLVTGGAFALLWHTKEFPRRSVWLWVLAAATLSTFGRGGIIVAAVAVVVPVLIRRFGAAAAVVLVAPVAWLIGTQLSEHGNSSLHAEGLERGAQLAFSGLFGAGFGEIGNAVNAAGWSRPGESLLGIAFAAGGVAAIGVVVVLVARLFTACGGVWEAAVGVGVLVAALFSESAGALNGTIPLWLAVGVALRVLHERRSRMATVRV